MPEVPTSLILLLGDCPHAAAALAPTADMLESFGVSFVEVAPGEPLDPAARAVIVASADAVLPAAIASQTSAPVIRVPFSDDATWSKTNLLLRAEAWPREQDGVFATVAIGEAGARNAALLAISILALTDNRLRAAYDDFRQEQTDAVLRKPSPSCTPS